MSVALYRFFPLARAPRSLVTAELQSGPGPARPGRTGRAGGAYPILTTWPPAGHSFGPMPSAGAMLQFET